jgi:uncharacterized protein YcbK (DUF882 family)
MTPISIHRPPAVEHVQIRDTRVDVERTGAENFASLLAGAVQQKTEKPEPKRAEGTSELDRPEEKKTEDADEPKKAKRTRARGVPSAAMTNVVETTAALDPELQAKLARVVTRMKEETGLDVTISETYRSQERQNALFAQGRETPGQVVTWTQNSKHTQGRAVDVTLGGGAEMDAYATLQRIAGEEGLRTLGAKDPGHLELFGNGRPLNANAFASHSTSLTPKEPADAFGPGRMTEARLMQLSQVAQVAEVSQVSQVSQVAAPQVAEVAQVARPEMPGVSRGAPSPTIASTQKVEIIAAEAKPSSRETSADTNDKNNNGNGGNGKSEHRGGYNSALAAAVALRDASPSHAPAQPITAGHAMSAADRAAQIIAAYQDAPARPLSQITMNVDAGNGVTDKVQIAMRGASLNAAIDAGDTRGAEVMRSRADELVKALTKDGIDVESLRVRAAAPAVTSTVNASQTANDSTNHSRFERQNAWQQAGDRQRSQQDDRKQQQQRKPRGGDQ